MSSVKIAVNGFSAVVCVIIFYQYLTNIPKVQYAAACSASIPYQWTWFYVNKIINSIRITIASIYSLQRTVKIKHISMCLMTLLLILVLFKVIHLKGKPLKCTKASLAV